MTCTVGLTCQACKATLTFHDERPNWKTYDYRVEEADACERSAAFVARCADEPLTVEGVMPDRVRAVYEELRPRYVGTRHRDDQDGLMTWGWDGRDARFVLAIPNPYRYVDCPVCDAHVKAPR